MFVTAYYDIYGKPEKFIEYMWLFYDLGISGLPITVFTDPSLVEKFRILPPSVRVIGIPLETFELYKIGISYQGELPGNRSVIKDTREFYSIMNTKIEFLKKASEVCEDDAFMWIDFGILKIVKNKERFINKLRDINKTSYDKIMMPGCWAYGRGFDVNQVNWRFCGGFFVVPRGLIQPFFEHSRNVLRDFCTIPMYKLTWETNVWVIVEMFALKDSITWYFADHDDSIVLNIDRVKSH